VIELIQVKKAQDIQEKAIQLYLDAIKRETSPEVLKIFEGFNRALERFIHINSQGVSSMVKTILVSMHTWLMRPILSPNSPTA
jgi:hypothetical protein